MVIRFINHNYGSEVNVISDNLPTIHKQISFPNIFLNSFTQFFTCKHRNKQDFYTNCCYTTLYYIYYKRRDIRKDKGRTKGKWGREEIKEGGRFNIIKTGNQIIKDLIWFSLISAWVHLSSINLQFIFPNNQFIVQSRKCPKLWRCPSWRRSVRPR